MRLRTVASLGAIAALLFAADAAITAQSAAAPKLHFNGLAPGEFVVQQQDVPVNIVLVGFGEDQVDTEDLLGILPPSYKPVVRYPQFYGLDGRNMGLEYTFDYSVRRTKPQFDDQFFAYLASIGTERARTAYQTAYNNQASNVLDIPNEVLDIDAASVEAWLVEHAKPRRNAYTVYFVNWYGRSDFRFHYYSKRDEPDPDTGFAFGALGSRAISSWGGTTSRTWFYDFSAGPEYNTDNWVVDVEDLNGDGVAENRMPPIWEYSDYGFRPPSQLGSDMGLLTRFVAINLLFTTSPLYDPLTTAPGPSGRKVVDTTVLEDDPASDGIDFYDPAFAEDKWRSFQPYYDWATATRAVDPIDPGADQALAIFSGNSNAPDCWTAYGTPSAQLFCYFTANLGLYLPSYDPADYVVPVFAFNTTAAGLADEFGLLGFADDNWVDGTQSLVFTFNAAAYRALGYGFTATTVHEVGHHIGVSHPHDGYDSEFDIDYGPGGVLYFAWEGDESDTVMHYLSLSNGFGAHNRDNMYRWETAGYLNWANALAGDILASADMKTVMFRLIQADRHAAAARAHFRSWRYLEAVAEARLAYEVLVEAAASIDVTSQRLAAAMTPLPASLIEKYICRPRDIVERAGLVN